MSKLKLKPLMAAVGRVCCGSLDNRKWDLSLTWCRLFVLIILVVLFPQTAADCDFPTALQNSNYTSTSFDGTLEFQVSTLNYAEDGVTSWTCNMTSGSQYIIRSDQTVLSFGLQAYYYYCLSLTQWTSYSFSYYLQTTLDNTKRRKTLPINHTTTLDFICDDTLDAAEFNVMVNLASPESAKSTCVSPLLGDFQYTFNDQFDGTEKCGSSPGDGLLNVCTNLTRNLLAFDYTACSELVGYSTGGVLYCIAYTSSTSGSTTTYYQSLYNADTSAVTQFTCMAVSSSTDVNGTTRVYVSQTPTACSAGQSSTTAPDTTGDTLVLTASVTCPITDEDSASVGLIVGITLGILLLAVLVALLLFYFCYWTKRDPDAGKPIVENTKPRFEEEPDVMTWESRHAKRGHSDMQTVQAQTNRRVGDAVSDPDNEDTIEEIIDLEDNASTIVTRDDIMIEAGSPSFLPNGKPVVVANGVPTASYNKGSYVTFNGGLPNGSLRHDSGIALTEKSSDRPTPRIGLNHSKEAMVIFNGDEKVISGNDSRIIPAENPNARTFRTMNPNMGSEEGILSLDALEENETGDSLGELTPRDCPFPSLPRQKSNLMPPIETVDPECGKTE